MPLKPQVKYIPSPNFKSGRDTKITAIIMHNTELSLADTIKTFQDNTPGNRVSSHYIVARSGEIIQMVQDKDTAWHAISYNHNSIGIEHEADEHNQGLTSLQEKASIELVKYLMYEYHINLENVKPHRDVVNTDCPKWLWKTDELFDKWKQNNLIN